MPILTASGTTAKTAVQDTIPCLAVDSNVAPHPPDYPSIALSHSSFFWCILIVLAMAAFGRPIHRILSSIADRIEDGDELTVWKATIRGKMRPPSEINNDIEEIDL